MVNIYTTDDIVRAIQGHAAHLGMQVARYGWDAYRTGSLAQLVALACSFGVGDRVNWPETPEGILERGSTAKREQL